MLANLALTYNKAWSGVEQDRNPLFYHPEFQVFAPYADPPNVAFLRMISPGLTQQTSDIFNLQKINALWSGNNPDLLLDYADFNGFHEFLKQSDLSMLGSSLDRANGDQLNPRTSTPHFNSSSGPTTIYIGHNPQTGTYLDGIIESISSDPPNWGI